MTKKVKTSITFISTPDYDDWFDSGEMTDEELKQYYAECFYDDIVSFMNSGELFDIIDVEIIND